MDVPVDARAPVEAIVHLGTKGTREGGRKVVEDEVVPEEAYEDLVGMIW